MKERMLQALRYVIGSAVVLAFGTAVFSFAMMIVSLLGIPAWFSQERAGYRLVTDDG